MKIGNNIHFAAVGLMSLFSTVAAAGTVGDSSIKSSMAAEMSSVSNLEKIIQANTEQKLIDEAKKYNQVVALAGDRQDEVAKRKNEAISAKAKWHELKTAVEVSHNPTANDLKTIDLAAQAYSKAYKAFIDLQKDILANNGVPSDAINTLTAKNVVPFNILDAINAAPPTAAGVKKR